MVLVPICNGQGAAGGHNEFPQVFGLEAWRQLFEEFEPHPPVESQEMCQAFLSPAK